MASKVRKHPKARKSQCHPCHRRRKSVMRWAKRKMRELRAKKNLRGVRDMRAYMKLVRRYV